MQQQKQQHGGQLEESILMPPEVCVTSMNGLGQCRGPMHQDLQDQVPVMQQHAQGKVVHNAAHWDLQDQELAVMQQHAQSIVIHNVAQTHHYHMTQVPQYQPGQQQIPLQRNNVPQQALQQLLQTLKSPNSPQQQTQVLTILNSNPQLMVAFDRQRSAHQQHEQLQQDNMEAAGQSVPQQQMAGH